MPPEPNKQAVEGSLAPDSEDGHDGLPDTSTLHVHRGTPPSSSPERQEALDDNDEYLLQAGINKDELLLELEEDEAEIGTQQRRDETALRRPIPLSQEQITATFYANLASDFLCKPRLGWRGGCCRHYQSATDRNSGRRHLREACRMDSCAGQRCCRRDRVQENHGRTQTEDPGHRERGRQGETRPAPMRIFPFLNSG